MLDASIVAVSLIHLGQKPEVLLLHFYRLTLRSLDIGLGSYLVLKQNVPSSLWVSNQRLTGYNNLFFFSSHGIIHPFIHIISSL